MITVTEEAKVLLKHVERPEGKVLRLDPVDAHQRMARPRSACALASPVTTTR